MHTLSVKMSLKIKLLWMDCTFGTARIGLILNLCSMYILEFRILVLTSW